jgi:hypothetical protein
MALEEATRMLIDCDACAVRGSGCADCVISVLIGAPPVGVELDALPAGVELEDEELAALGALAAAGLDPQFLAIGGAAEPDESLRERHRADRLGDRDRDRARRRAG